MEAIEATQRPKGYRQRLLGSAPLRMNTVVEEPAEPKEVEQKQQKMNSIMLQELRKLKAANYVKNSMLCTGTVAVAAASAPGRHATKLDSISQFQCKVPRGAGRLSSKGSNSSSSSVNGDLRHSSDTVNEASAISTVARLTSTTSRRKNARVSFAARDLKGASNEAYEEPLGFDKRAVAASGAEEVSAESSECQPGRQPLGSLSKIRGFLSAFKCGKARRSVALTKISQAAAVPPDFGCETSQPEPRNLHVSQVAKEEAPHELLPSAMPACQAPQAPPKPSLLMRRREGKKLPALELKENVATPEAALLEEEYEVVEMLGKGSTSTVYRAFRRNDQMQIALKRMRSTDPEMHNAAESEFKLMKTLAHPNILRALDFHVFSGQAVIALEFFNGKPLDQTVHRRTLSAREARPLATQLFMAIAYLHKEGLIHRDVKPENILVSEDLDLRLIDFNSAADLDTSFSPAGAKLYQAPEVLLGEASNTASDVWAAALCVFFMLSHRLPQLREQNMTMRQLEACAKEKVSLDGKEFEEVPACRKLLANCLSLEREDRPSADKVLKEWLTMPEGLG